MRYREPIIDEDPPPAPASKSQMLVACLVGIILALAVIALFLWGNPTRPPDRTPRLRLVEDKVCGSFALLRGRYFPPSTPISIVFTMLPTTRQNIPAPEFFSPEQTLQTDANGEFELLVNPIAQMDAANANAIYYGAQLNAGEQITGLPIGFSKDSRSPDGLSILPMLGSIRIDIDDPFTLRRQNPTTDTWYVTYFQDQDQFIPIAGEQHGLTSVWFPVGLAQSSDSSQLNQASHSATFTRTIKLPGPLNLKLTLLANGGAQVYHSDNGTDWTTIIDAKASNGQPQQVSLPLHKGDHYFKVSYYEGSAAARLCFAWRESYAGWKARYYPDLQLSSPTLIRDDQNIDFAWLTTAPPSLPMSGYSISWDRDYDLAGEYEFKIESDQYARVFVDGRDLSALKRWPDSNVANIPGADPPLNATQTCRLNPGQHRITVHYRNTGNPAHIKFSFTQLDATKRAVEGQTVTCP